MTKPVIDLDKLRGITRESQPSAPVTTAPEQKSQIKERTASVAKKFAVAAMLTAATLSPTERVSSSPKESANTRAEIELAEQRREKILEQITQNRSSELSAEIVNNLDDLQNKIETAKDKGQRNPVVKKLLASVYTRGGLSGANDYCVAGAMYAHLQCEDDIMRKILPDPEKSPQDFAAEYNNEFSSHPNVSCSYLQKFFRTTYGENYAQPKDANFKTVLQNLEAGDIITVRSEGNTQSGHHCVTCIGSVKDGAVRVKSLNGESTYNVDVRRISSAACVMKQYRETYMREMANEMPAEIFTPIANKKLQLDTQIKAPLAPMPSLAEHISDKPALSYAQLYKQYTQNGRM